MNLEDNNEDEVYASMRSFSLDVSSNEHKFRHWLSGQKVTILGRSDIVGMPTFLSLLKLDASVSMCHSRSMDTQARIAEADILVAAIGKPEWVQPGWLKQKSIVIDVGIHCTDPPEVVASSGESSKKKWVGDVLQRDRKGLVDKDLRFITPVPGGVGPMTVAMLLDNVIIAAESSILY
jgi:methylenetetrahydrofolate dehydrogenase (NADP+) / methenyltetrahydrofolate cyclohydrolase / formyltetrahydrofolate synthetase